MSILTDIFDVTENAISGKKKKKVPAQPVVILQKQEVAPSPEKSTNIA